jgi:hypothetical protein
MQLAAGDGAPSPRILNQEGQSVCVSDFWQTCPAALFFVRHFG